MFTTVSAQLSTVTLRRLIDHLSLRGVSHDISESVNTALEFWLDAQSQLPPGAQLAGIHGYQWKSLFLPEGTVLRSWSYGEHNFARVEGDKIMHLGQSVSPNEFARFFARSNRNAWFDLWVRRPCDKHFKMAAILRKELAQQEKLQQRALDCAPVPAAPVPIPCAGAAASTATDNIVAPPTVTAPGPARATAVSKSDFDPGWDLPERRKFRLRAEDIAF